MFQVKTILLGLLFLLPVISSHAAGDIPLVINYQGKIADNGGTVVDGDGFFKFAMVNAAGDSAYWVNDGTTNDGTEPTTAVTIPVENGLFSVKLGDTSLANMPPIDTAVFDNTLVFLRVWFSFDGLNFEQFTPDAQIVSSGYTFKAARATLSDDADTLDGNDSSAFQQSILGSCAGQVMVGINADGTVNCEEDDTGLDTEADPTVPDSIKDGVEWNEVSNIPADFADGIDNIGGNGDITAVTAGAGLSGGGQSGDVALNADTGYLQRRVSASCKAGSAIREITDKGEVLCETDDVGEESAGIQYKNIGECENIPARMKSCGSITVNVPRSGYLLVQLSGYADTFNGNTAVRVGIGEDDASFSHFVEAGHYNALDDVVRSFPIHSTFVYPITAGNKKIYINAIRLTNIFSRKINLENLYITAVFVPNKY